MQAVLAARIDRLPAEEKRLLQTAAVIGTEVPLPLLHAIADVPEAGLQRHLTALQSAEFLYETCLFPEREYTFKHALTHEVAYSSLLLERRRVLHARIVEALDALAGEPSSRAGRSPGAPCPAGGGVGQGSGVLPAGWGEDHGAVGLSRGSAAYTPGGRGTDAVPLLTQAMEQSVATGTVFQALCRLPLGEAQLLAGRLEGGSMDKGHHVHKVQHLFDQRMSAKKAGRTWTPL